MLCIYSIIEIDILIEYEKRTDGHAQNIFFINIILVLLLQFDVTICLHIHNIGNFWVPPFVLLWSSSSVLGLCLNKSLIHTHHLFTAITWWSAFIFYIFFCFTMTKMCCVCVGCLLRTYIRQEELVVWCNILMEMMCREIGILIDWLNGHFRNLFRYFFVFLFPVIKDVIWKFVLNFDLKPSGIFWVSW